MAPVKPMQKDGKHNTVDAVGSPTDEFDRGRFRYNGILPMDNIRPTLEVNNHKGNELPARKESGSLAITIPQGEQKIDLSIERELSRKSLFIKQVIVMELWFLCSLSTILSNKYYLSTLDGDPGILGECQLMTTTVMGLVMMYLPCKRFSTKKSETPHHVRPLVFLKTMAILGWLRFGAVVCSIVSLKYVPISFSETIKSSAPLFTVLTAYVILGEKSGLLVNLSLMPIMSGLAICSVNELSFTFTGFVAAMSNNILDCVQNVFSKKLLTGEHKYSPPELQFYTSVAAAVVQLPFWLFFMDFREKVENLDKWMVGILLCNGVLFYLQSLLAYSLMSLISPITFSVASTAKRALLIWFSVIVFGNPVSVMSAIGTVMVILGVALYQRARQQEAAARREKENERYRAMSSA